MVCDKRRENGLYEMGRILTHLARTSQTFYRKNIYKKSPIPRGETRRGNQRGERVGGTGVTRSGDPVGRTKGGTRRFGPLGKGCYI